MARRSLLLGLLLAMAAAPAASGAAPPGGALTGPIATGSVQRRDIPADIVRIAQGELEAGVRELPLGSDDSPQIALYRGAIVPRARPEAWCAIFVSWVTRAAGAPIGARGAGIVGVAGIESWARRTGRWTHRPRAGDVVVYSGHAGIVTSVRGSRMQTVEGNWSNRVSGLDRRRADALGFVRIAVGSRLAGRARR
jgi:hypothetical protein